MRLAGGVGRRAGLLCLGSCVDLWGPGRLAFSCNLQGLHCLDGKSMAENVSFEAES